MKDVPRAGVHSVVFNPTSDDFRRPEGLTRASIT
jgi:hypothetical protein